MLVLQARRHRKSEDVRCTNEDAAELLAMLLTKHGHRVVIALDPVQALEAVRVSIPDKHSSTSGCR